MAVAGVGELAHQGQVRRLVGGIEVEDVAPPTGEAQDVEVTQSQLLPSLLGPSLVAVGGQELATPAGAAPARPSSGSPLASAARAM